MEGSPSHRWRMEIENGGYSRPGYSQLGGRGQVEPEMSGRFNSCGLADRQSRPWSATGAGGF